MSPALQVNKETQVHRGSQVLKVRLVHPETKVHLENRGFLACLEQMVPRVTLGRKDPLARREIRVQPVLRAQLDILALAVSREPTVSVV